MRLFVVLTLIGQAQSGGLRRLAAGCEDVLFEANSVDNLGQNNKQNIRIRVDTLRAVDEPIPAGTIALRASTDCQGWEIKRSGVDWPFPTNVDVDEDPAVFETALNERELTTSNRNQEFEMAFKGTQEDPWNDESCCAKVELLCDGDISDVIAVGIKQPAAACQAAEQTPEPTPQPTPEPSPSPTPQPTPEPTPSPTPQPTPEPSPSPTPQQTPEPSPSPTPQQTPEPSPSPTPQQTPEPSPSPTPQQTPEPSSSFNEDSSGYLTVSGAAQDTFQAQSVVLNYDVVGAELDVSRDILVQVNGVKYELEFVQASTSITASDTGTVSSTSITVPLEVNSGKNVVDLFAIDVTGLVLSLSQTFWAGSAMLDVTTVDTSGVLVAGATVTVKLSDDLDVGQTLTTDASGVARFENLPGRTLIVTAQDSTGGFGTAALIGGFASATTVVIAGFGTPSPIENNDFSLGTTEGWDTSQGNAFIIEHVDDAEGTRRLQETDWDLVVATAGQEGKETVSRTFEVSKPGVESIRARWKFQTDEIPGGYFGSEFNDHFSVSIRAQTSGSKVFEASSMNTLGLSAFNAQGETLFREITLPVTYPDVIQVDLTAENVQDGAYDCRVTLDLVEEVPLAITSFELNDIDGADIGDACSSDPERLKFLSADAHPYFGGNTVIYGKISIQGEPGLELTNVRLEVVQGGAVVAEASLAAGASASLLATIPDTGKLEITEKQHLFDLSSSQADMVDSSSDGTVNLRVVAEAVNADGQMIDDEKDFNGTVKILGLFNGDRFPGSSRDLGRGGDGWALPSTLDWAYAIQEAYGVTFNDFCNMNCGCFEPDHNGHDKGNDVDCKHPTHIPRDAAAAAFLIDILNTPTFGSQVQIIGTTFTSSFRDAINGVSLDDGRMATDVISNWTKHTEHFHVRLKLK